MATTTERNGNGLTFDEWLRACDLECLEICGLTLNDLPDRDSWSAWHDEIEPYEFVHDLLEEEGFPF